MEQSFCINVIPRDFDLFFCLINVFFCRTRHSNISGQTLRGILEPTIMVKSVGTIPIFPLPQSMLENQLHTVRDDHQLTPTLIRVVGGGGGGGGS